MSSRFYFLAFSLMTLFSASKADLSKYKFNHINIIDDDLLKEYKDSTQVTVVYYYMYDVPRLSGFFKQLDKSAEFLLLYGVHVGVYDCNKEQKAEICKEERVERKFFTYSNGRELIQLDLETMFDLNSIMSNILQLVLLREVPILQSKDERAEYEDKYKGKHNIVFGYQKAIGTFEHRIFMEVAYAFQDNFKFAVSTAKAAVEGLQDYQDVKGVAVWVLQCKEAKTKADTCTDFMYKENMDLATLAGYFRALTLPRTFDVPSNGMDIPYLKDGGMHVVYLFYNKNNKKDVWQKAAVISDSFKGVLGTVTVDSESDFKVAGFSGKTPAVAVHLKNHEVPVFMTDDFTDANIHSFVYNQIKTTRIETPSKSQEEMIEQEEEQPVEEKAVDVADEKEMPAEYIPDDVEEQDDQVSESVYRARFKNEMDLDLVPTLTDKTFPTTLQGKNMIFVLFYLPFDQKSMAFLRAYGDASRKLENETEVPLARVDCHDWTDVCGNEKVFIYPHIRIYQKGKTLMDYNGLLDTDEVVKTAKLLKHIGHSELKNVQDIENFILGIFPDGDKMPANTSVLALFDKSHKKEFAVLKEVVSDLKGKLAFGVNTNGQGKNLAKTQFNTNLPVLVLHKRSDTLEPVVVYNGKFDETEILKFISEAGLPKMPQLTVELFPVLYAKKKPFVIAFLDGEEQSNMAKAELEQVVKADKISGVNFCWLPVSGTTSFGRKILDVYNKTAEVPAISYVNLLESKVYNFGEEKMKANTISVWLRNIQKGHLQPSAVLEKGEWKPLKKGYNFLGMMDWEAKHKTSKESDENDVERETAEEFGVGFDKDGNEIDYDQEIGALEEDRGDTDSDIRDELLQLRNSRLYHQHDKSRKVHAQHEAVLHREADMHETSDKMMDDSDSTMNEKKTKHEEL